MCNMKKQLAKAVTIPLLYLIIPATAQFLEEVPAPNLDIALDGSLDQEQEASQGLRSYGAWSVPGPPYSGLLSARTLSRQIIAINCTIFK